MSALSTSLGTPFVNFEDHKTKTSSPYAHLNLKPMKTNKKV